MVDLLRVLFNESLNIANHVRQRTLEHIHKTPPVRKLNVTGPNIATIARIGRYACGDEALSHTSSKLPGFAIAFFQNIMIAFKCSLLASTDCGYETG